MENRIKLNDGSFRDPCNRVYELQEPNAKNIRLIRGLDKKSLDNYRKLSETDFYAAFVQKKMVVISEEITSDKINKDLIEKWDGFIEHNKISFISYPYEWTFSMLKDAALLHLDLLESSLENGWILKDATPYNIQFQDTQPIFIDIPSFEPWIEGEPWNAYRQFCSNFLTPLLIKAHLNIEYINLLRSSLDGIPPTEAIKFFSGFKIFKKGVIPYIYFPAKIENNIIKNERDNAASKNRKPRRHTKIMVISLVQSIKNLIRKIEFKAEHTNWSKYDKTHSYSDNDFNTKKEFIEKHASGKLRNQIWDIGCNTGTFSEICSKYCDQVISIDADFAAIENLYLSEKNKTNSNILPLIIDISNISPSQGFAGKERKGFDKRGKPDLIICLALIHHIRITSNIPNSIFIKYLRSLNSDVIIEFVDRQDEMVKKLLTNKKEKYADYNRDQFIYEIKQYFTIIDRQPLKTNKRELFFITPI